MQYVLKTLAKSGGKVWAAGKHINVRRLTAAGDGPDTRPVGILGQVSAPGVLGELTGRALVALGRGAEDFFEVTTVFGTGFVRRDLFTGVPPVATTSDGDGKGLVLNLLRRENGICRHLLYAGELLRRHEAAGRPVAAHRAKLEQLKARYLGRRRKLMADRNVRFDVKVEPGFGPLAARAAVAGIGVLPVVWGLIALGTVALVAIGWRLCYTNYKLDAEATEIDLKDARALAGVLEGVDPPTKLRVLEEIETFAKKERATGNAAGQEEAGGGLTGGLKQVKNLGLIAAGVWALSKFS